jgi:hypothetical protein
MAGEMSPMIPLEGVATTHPTLALTPQQSGLDIAQTQALQASAGLTGEQTQKVSLENQLAALNLQNNAIYAKAIGTVRQSVLQKASAAGGSPTPTPTTPAGGVSATQPTNVGGAAPPAAGPSPSPGPTTSGTDQSQNPPGTVNVLPDGVDPSWKIDKSHDWYTDANGAPISVYAGPTQSPLGRINLHSAALQDQIADEMERQGAQPQFVAAMRVQGEQKAVEFDKTNVGVFKDIQESTKAAADAQEAMGRARLSQNQYVTNLADQALNSPNSQAAIIQDIALMPGIFGNILADAVQKDNQGNLTSVDMNKAIPILKSLQAQSPAYQERVKTNQAGVHIVPGTDENGSPTINVVKIGPNGEIINTPTGITPQGYFSPAAVQAQVDAIYNGDQAPPTLSARNPGSVQVLAALRTQHPDYDVTTYNEKQQAVNKFATGTQGLQLNALNTADSHLDSLQQAATALKNGDTRALNYLANKLSVAVGATPVITFNTIAETAGKEVVRASVPGQSGEKERESAVGLLNSDSSPQQIQAAIDADRALMAGKAKALQLQYVTSMPNPGIGSSDPGVVAGRQQRQQRYTQEFQEKLTPGIKNSPVFSGQSASTTTAAPKAGDLVTDSKGVTWAYKGSGDPKDINNYIRVQ